MADVVMRASCLRTPRIIEHRCSASITTATPCGCSSSLIKSATWRVIRSCTCSRRANISTMRGILESPITRPRRNIGYMRPADKWQHVVLAQAVKLDVAHDHHLIVLNFKKCIIDHRNRVHPVARQQFFIHAGHPFGRAQQAFPAAGPHQRPRSSFQHWPRIFSWSIPRLGAMPRLRK